VSHNRASRHTPLCAFSGARRGGTVAALRAVVDCERGGLAPTAGRGARHERSRPDEPGPRAGLRGLLRRYSASPHPTVARSASSARSLLRRASTNVNCVGAQLDLPHDKKQGPAGLD